MPPTGTAVAGSKQERARTIKDLFWTDDEDSLNYFAELVETKRFDDERCAVGSGLTSAERDF